MKLIYYVIIRISLVLSVLLTGWAILFYFTVMDEVNDEVDDSLEDYSEIIIIRALAGEELPSKNTASNNQYFLREVTKEYAGSRDDILYKDSMVYIPEKDETEPARILTTIFKDDGEKFFELTVATPSIEKDDLKDAMAGGGVDENPSDFGAYNEAEQVFVIAFEDRERSIYGYYPSRSE